MSSKKKLIKKVAMISAALGAIGGLSSIIHSTNAEACTTRSSIKRNSTNNNIITSKRPTTNAIPDHNVDEEDHHTKDFISPPMSPWENNSNKDRSKHARARANGGSTIIVNISTNK